VRSHSSRIAAGAIAILCLACDDPPPEVCDGAGDAAVELHQREDPGRIVDGSEVSVFPPPQGGVWTEIDVTLIGVRTDDVTSLRVDIMDEGNVLLGSEFYLGEGLPLACQMDGTIEIDNMPVGFHDDTVLEDLEGVEATMTTTLAHAGGEVVDVVAVTLRVGSF
jgi:hypothetical protein